MIVIILAILGIISFFLTGTSKRAVRRKLLMGGAFLHNIFTILLFFIPNQLSFAPYFAPDSISKLFLSITSAIFTLVAVYTLGYLPLKRPESDEEAGGHIFTSCMLFFLASMTLAICTAQVGILWISIEATTLSSAPLIYYKKNKRSLEAAWKYLLICSVGIAIALLGIFLVAAGTKGNSTDLSVSSLVSLATQLDKNLLKLGFILVLVGFGTKMGLAPMHNWLPDAHSEAPSPISALLSGCLLNCALLGIIRFYQILTAAGLHDFASHLLIIFGVLSLATAAIFVTSQKDYKRLLAYSSIEHMGIITLGLGIGANFASMLHVVGHSLTKVLLFLTAGNVLFIYKSKKASEVTGLLSNSPTNGWLLIIGSFAILGFPPFLPFISEFLILKHGLAGGHDILMGLYLLFLCIVFVSMSKIIFKMVYGKFKDQYSMSMPRYLILPPVLLAVAVIALGIYMPEIISQAIIKAGNILKLY